MWVFEKIIEKLEELTEGECTLHECGIKSENCKSCIAKKAIEIVKHEASEYNNGWIPCSDQLPELNKMVLLYTPYDEYDPISIGCLYQDDDDNRSPYFKWFLHSSAARGGLNYIICLHYICPGIKYVIAWKQLQEPYKTKGE